MRQLITRVTLTLFATLTFGTVSAQNLYITGGSYFDVVSGEMVRNQGIVIRSGKFVRVNEALAASEDYEELTLSDDQYLLPGIFDLHAHYRVTFDGVRRDEVEANPVIFLANGVTSTFPGGEIQPEVMLEARRKIDRGEKIGARIHSSGPYFGTAFPAWNRGTTIEDIYATVDKWAELGVAGFKAKGISPVLLKALIERAHLHGLPVTGHLGSGFRNTVNPRDAITMGIDRVEHFLGGDALPNTQSAYATLQNLDINDPAVDKQIDHFIANGVFFDATLTAYGYYGHRNSLYDYWHNERQYLTPYAFEITKETRQELGMFQKIFDVKKVTVKKFFDKGGKITLGTDHPSVGEFIPGFSAHREMEALVSIGIPNAEVLKIATINGAEALRKSDILGSIEVSKLADAFVITGNPLEEITNTRNVQKVIKGGLVYDSKTLLKSVEGKMGPKDEEDWK
ncbi:amidohydrolase family protein [Roseivirga sp. E12]|uniref:amidohydrolase family protein n=1 Tax=Roseivirga sp. E12 TaxID=2819237 RepID=UPI001ABC85D8|nr:amidohydrolase family protein [Roseivirga sp. E12]MBO3698855.1 amidohydrolase family protein [Roseivirga sp. E12]